VQLNQETLLQSIRQNKLFSPESRLLLAVSGGADSLALLHALAHLRPIYPVELNVATLNHGLRPEAAEEVAFVQEMAAAWNVPCITGKVELDTTKLGIEAAARKARYDFLAEVAQSTNSDYTLTAHQADDQTETILMHLLRGSGLQGLIGMKMLAPMPYHPEYQLIRPLLPFSRQSIEAYCAEHSLEARQDSSNFDTSYRRNAIRHEIVPRLRQVNPQLDAALARLGKIVEAEDAFVQDSFKQLILPQMDFSERVRISRQAFLSWHVAMQRRAILAALSHLNTLPDFERIESAIELIQRGKLGAILEFSDAVQLRLDYEDLFIEALGAQYIAADFPQNPYDTPLQLAIPSTIQLSSHLLTVSDAPLPDAVARLAPPVDAQIVLRSRHDGDMFKPLGMGGKSRKLKKCLIDRKIPHYLRDKLPLLEINEEIAAIILPHAWGISESFAVKTESERLIYFSVKKL
jgi:tRNA(Ile)-lysidine synthase